MNTFLPEPAYDRCARVLDGPRLGKQLVECQQILNVLLGLRAGYAGHPAVRMWRGHEAELVRYAETMAAEWYARRGREHGSWGKIRALAEGRGLLRPPRREPPWFLGHPWLVGDHRRNLVRKDPALYGGEWPGLAPLEGYRWPVAPGAWLDLRAGTRLLGEAAFRRWPCGTLQDVEDGPPYGWTSDDFEIVDAGDLSPAELGGLS